MNTRSALQNFTFWQRFIRILLAVWIFWQIFDDLYIVVVDGWNLYKYNTHPSPQFFASMWILIGGSIIFLAIYLSYTFWFAQFVLPVTLLEQRFKAFKLLSLYGISLGRWHGPAVFVHNGELIATSDEIEKGNPGVAFIDLRSAMTLDNLHDDDNEYFINRSKRTQQVYFPFFRTKPHDPRIRAVGPGLTFIEKNEKITGVVDLRPQNRGRPDISADTRDGIRVSTRISCSFSLGEPADILDVCLSGEKNEQVFVIEWEKDVSTGKRKIKQLSKELHPKDEEEIHNFFIHNPNPAVVYSDVPAGHFPYTFDPKRVEHAIYSVTNLLYSQQHSKNWNDWPQDITAEKFRVLLSQYPYLDLYDSKNPHSNAMKDLSTKLSTQVRNTGILAYRIITTRNGSNLEEGKTYETRELIFYPARNLNRSDVLRDRGIKVDKAGFGELTPKDKSIQRQRMASWLSSKQKETDMKQADASLEAGRIINNARIRSQRNMIYHFTQLLESHDSPREALAMLIYQELEATAANPETRRLLPEDTLSLLTGIGQMLLPMAQGSDESNTDGHDSLGDESGQEV